MSYCPPGMVLYHSPEVLASLPVIAFKTSASVLHIDTLRHSISLLSRRRSVMSGGAARPEIFLLAGGNKVSRSP